MKRSIAVMILLILLFSLVCVPGIAETNALESSTTQNTVVVGKVYTFDEDNDYEFSKSTEYKLSSTAGTYGTLRIAGTGSTLTEQGKKNGVPAFSVANGSIAVSYTYTDLLLNASEKVLHLVSDNDNEVDIIDLEDDIKNGALILQRSIDRLNWNDVVVQTNAFEDTPKQTEAMYVTTEPEMINGCYYRLIVAYKTAIKGEPSSFIGIFETDTYTYQRVAEVYEFYACQENAHIEPLQSNTKRYSLGETVKVEHSASYSGQKEIESGDLHYGWDLGQFFVSGYTDKVENDGSLVFLKNAGDVVTLWFNLKQNINALNGDKDVTIAFDEEGSDQYFQTPTTKFGRGMLIIRYTDHENVKHDPVMYYDYLAANTSMGADTRAQLFEEGDYEVALDYEIEEDGVAFLGSTGHYRIFFKFSVRNANCMVFPFDVSTGEELTNSAMTENGFYLDLARSRYLTIFVKKEVRTEGTDGLTEDTRFNTIAKDGDRYTDEGIYTITAKNNYTGLETVKRIYVGSDPVMRAHIVTGRSVPELIQLVNAGATIYEDGTIDLPQGASELEPVTEPEIETEAPTEPEATTLQTESATEESAPLDETGGDDGNTALIVGGAAGIAAAAGIAFGVILKKKHAKKGGKESNE